MSKIKKEKYIDKYWICQMCADQKGWKVVPWAITVTEGKCAHCKSGKTTTMIPTTDFTGKTKQAVFD